MNGLDFSVPSESYLDQLQAVGVGCWYRSEEGRGVSDFASALAFLDEHRERIAQARTVRDIRSLHREGKIAYLSGWQSAEALIPAASTEPAISHLRVYQALGLRICGIAYNVTNAFGGGCLEPHIGLTRAGRRLVERIHQQRIVLDVGGHTGEQASLDAIGMSGGVPVICSHTNCQALNDNPRCTSDRVLEAIAQSGGVIGVTAFSDFHTRRRRDTAVRATPRADLDRHLDEYDYLKSLVGVDHIGLGPDFMEGYDMSDLLSPGSHSFAAEIYSPQLPWSYVSGFEGITQLPNLTQ